MGKGGVEPAALLHLRPHLARVGVERGPHRLKRVRQAAELVVALSLYREVQVAGRDARARAVERHYRPAQPPAPKEHGADYQRAQIADGQGQRLQYGDRPVPERVRRGVRRHDEKRVAFGVVAHAYLYGSLAVGYGAALDYVAFGVVDDVDLLGVGVDIYVVRAAVGYLYALGTLLVLEVQADPVLVQEIYDHGADKGGQDGGNEHVPDKGRAQ